MRKKKKKKVRKGRGKVPGARVSEGVGLELAESESETSSCIDSCDNMCQDELVMDWMMEIIQKEVGYAVAKMKKTWAHQISRRNRSKNQKNSRKSSTTTEIPVQATPVNQVALGVSRKGETHIMKKTSTTINFICDVSLRDQAQRLLGVVPCIRILGMTVGYAHDFVTGESNRENTSFELLIELEEFAHFMGERALVGRGDQNVVVDALLEEMSDYCGDSDDCGEYFGFEDYCGYDKYGGDGEY